MPLDAVCLTGVVRELENNIVGLRIEKIQQPSRDQVVLTLRGNQKLLLCAGANAPRIHLTRISRENPAAAPMFCMLLRKHLTGGRITAITQPALERVVMLNVDILDEMGEPGKRTIVLECMGRRSNLILLDGDGRIIECLRRVDLEMSESRQVLPGLFYHLPPAQEKLDPLTIEEPAFEELLAQAGTEPSAADFLLDHFFGLSPLVCRELAWQALGGVDGRMMDQSSREKLKEVYFRWQNSVKENRFTPHLISKDNKPSDFSYLPICQYGEGFSLETMESFSQLLDHFYEKREMLERVRQKGQELLRTASSARDRMVRKLALQEKEYAKTLERDQLRMYGELITANLYRMKKGEKVLEAQNYYDPDCPTIRIPLDPLLTPQQNSARYFKQYNKAKTAEIHLTEQMDIARRERDWLESVLDA